MEMRVGVPCALERTWMKALLNTRKGKLHKCQLECDDVDWVHGNAVWRHWTSLGLRNGERGRCRGWGHLVVGESSVSADGNPQGQCLWWAGLPDGGRHLGSPLSLFRMMPRGGLMPTQHVPGAFLLSPSSRSCGLTRGKSTRPGPCACVSWRSLSPDRAMNWQNVDLVLCETWKVNAGTVLEYSFYLFIYLI